MRTIILLLLMSISTMTFAEKIELVLHKDIRFTVQPPLSALKKYRLSEIPFIVDVYEVLTDISNPYYMKSDNTEEVNIKNSQSMRIYGELHLISYDEKNNQYKFNVILSPEIGLWKERNLGTILHKSVPAKVHFIKNNNNSILLSDTFFDENSSDNPPDVSGSKDDLRLLNYKFKDMGMIVVRDIPISIELND